MTESKKATPEEMARPGDTDYTQDTAFERITAALDGVVRRSDNQISARCPSHDDKNPSLSVTGIEGQTLMHCHAGCETKDVLEAVGMTMADLFDTGWGASYVYDDGRTVHRSADKQFKQEGNTKGAPTLYRLEKVREAVTAGRTIYLVEGEKDVHALEAVGEIATTAPMGATNFGKVDVTPLKGATVVAIPDRDASGEKWRALVKSRLEGFVSSLSFAEVKAGKDFADHLAAGHTVVELKVTVPEKLFISGADFLLTGSQDEAPLWGGGDVHLWAPGESLMLVGPPGVGKSTMAHLLVFGRLGLLDSTLAWAVEPDDKKVLYLAMDRPRQIARAMYRLVQPEHMNVLAERLIVRNGPLPVDLLKQPEWLVEQALAAGAGTVVVDSIKDVLPGFEAEDVGQYNRARQLCLAAGIEWLELHHNRKANGTNKEPNTLDDVYGGRWLTAGAGSVMSLFGESGDTVISLKQLKTPAGEFFPRKVLLDKEHGLMSVYGEVTLDSLLDAAGSHGVSAQQAAERLFNTKKPSDSQRESVRGRLKRLAKGSTVEEFKSPVDEGQRFRRPNGVGETPTSKSMNAPTAPTRKASSQVKDSNAKTNASNATPTRRASLVEAAVGGSPQQSLPKVGNPFSRCECGSGPTQSGRCVTCGLMVRGGAR